MFEEAAGNYLQLSYHKYNRAALHGCQNSYSTTGREDDVAFKHFLGKEEVKFFNLCLYNLVSFLDTIIGHSEK